MELAPEGRKRFFFVFFFLQNRLKGKKERKKQNKTLKVENFQEVILNYINFLIKIWAKSSADMVFVEHPAMWSLGSNKGENWK